jgi:drug/metabolite transporter, DME family
MVPQLLALATSICYAVALISARKGLRYSTPATVTCASILVQVVTLWSVVFLRGGPPRALPLAVALFIFVGITQLGVRLLAYGGVSKIGASRSSALQAISPLISAAVAIAFLHERATPAVLLGTVLVVCGIVLISWRPEQQIKTFRWWHLLLPVGAALLTGINHPIRRYALTLSNEPLFFAALMGTASLVGFLGYVNFPSTRERLVWQRKAVGYFLVTGIAETLSISFIITALSIGPVVVIAPIAASYPLWALIGAAIFLREVERISALTVLGSLSIVAGAVAIHLGR